MVMAGMVVVVVRTLGVVVCGVQRDRRRVATRLVCAVSVRKNPACDIPPQVIRTKS